MNDVYWKTNKTIFCLQLSKYENVFYFIYNVQKHLLSYKIKQNM